MPGGNTSLEAWIWSIGDTRHGTAGPINNKTGDPARFGDFEFFWLIEGVLSHPGPLRSRQRAIPHRTDSMPPDKPLIAAETATSNTQRCGRCGVQLEGDHSYVHEFASTLCQQCFDAYLSEVEADAMVYAEREVMITKKLPDADSETWVCCTPDNRLEIEPAKVADFYLEHCRHECTNYDQLLSQFNTRPVAIYARIYRQAILDRVDELIIQEILRRPSKVGCHCKSDRETIPTSRLIDPVSPRSPQVD